MLSTNQNNLNDSKTFCTLLTNSEYLIVNKSCFGVHQSTKIAYIVIDYYYLLMT